MVHTSHFWSAHFQNNLKKQRVDWSIKPAITEEEKNKILYSLKAWQLGETSDGKHLLAATRMYAVTLNDSEYVSAVEYFIQEEQKHGRNLGMYIDLIGEKRATSDIGDALFRKIRYFNTSMELWTITVIIVESAAQIFYQALHDATNCQLLRSICRDILIDEAHHIKFQNERLLQIFSGKSFYFKALSVGLYGLLFFGTIHAIWIGHKPVFIQGNVSKTEFMRKMYHKFFNTLKIAHSETLIEHQVSVARV